jgi:hypothetical protein
MQYQPDFEFLSADVEFSLPFASHRTGLPHAVFEEN